ncbi:DUF6894 family protein [Bradyrhizobium sp.]|uniref:DUF6894 family protein n=1 Tax=Bradyrhizobium sp. TaxID=376 RepID=UPI0040378A5D
MLVQTFYFDIQDGVPVRDRKGLELANTSMAIEHSKRLATIIRRKEPPGRRDLLVVVTDQSGREVHREPVYPEAHEPEVGFRKVP